MFKSAVRVYHINSQTGKIISIFSVWQEASAIKRCTRQAAERVGYEETCTFLKSVGVGTFSTLALRVQCPTRKAQLTRASRCF